MEHDKAGRLGPAELAGRERVVADQHALGDHQPDSAGLRLVRHVLTHAEHGAHPEQTRDRGDPHGEDEELGPLDGVRRPPADQQEPGKRAVGHHRRDLDCGTSVHWPSSSRR